MALRRLAKRYSGRCVPRGARVVHFVREGLLARDSRASRQSILETGAAVGALCPRALQVRKLAGEKDLAGALASKEE